MDPQFNLIDRYWRAANYLTVGQIYLRANPLLREPLTADHIKPRLLGHWGTSPGLSFVYVHLNRLIRERDANVIYIAGPGHGGPALVANVVPRGHLLRGLSRHHRERRRHAAALPSVLDAGWHPEPRERADTGLDPRRRRARLRARARVRRRVRQPRPDRRVRDRRRRGRDRSARRVVEGRAVPQPEPRRRSAADPPSERRQDQRPDGARPHERRGRARAAARPRLRRGHGRRRRPRDDARAVRGDARRCVHEDPRDPGDAVHDSPPLARDRAAHAEGMDRTRRRRRGAGAGHVPLAPGAALERARQRRAPRDARRVDAQLRARRPVRREGHLPRRAQGPRPRRREAHGREPARERRQGVRAARHARLRRVRRRRSQARDRAPGVDPPARRADARPLRAQPNELPALLPGRDAVESPRRGLRGREPLHDGPDQSVRRLHVARRAGHGGVERAQLRGLARGLRAERSPRPLRDLRGVRDGAGVDGRAAREVARRVPASRMARAGAVAERAAHLDLLAQRPQRLQPSRPRVHRHDAVDAGRDHPRRICRPTPTACSPSRIIASAATTT